VAELFNDFPGLRNFRAEENGAEFVTKHEESLVRIRRDPFARDYKLLPDDETFLRVWSPELTNLDINAPINVTIEKVKHFSSPQNRWDPRPTVVFGRHLTFDHPISFPDKCDYERVYALPSDLILKPHVEYRISGWIRVPSRSINLFEFNFYTDSQGRPVAY
jgi:hypothetical protein